MDLNNNDFTSCFSSGEFKIIAERMAELINKNDAVRKSSKALVEAYSRIVPNLESILDDLRETLSELVKRIHFPNLTESEKNQLLESYAAWGKNGWTIPPDADLRLFHSKPIDAQDAYDKIRKFLCKENINHLLNDLTHEKKVKQSDLTEAINCYSQKYYKGCALILFSMIDARLIRAQERSDKKEEYRLTGKKAAEKIFNRIKDENIDERMLLTALNHLNILEALLIVFKKGEDFRDQPTIINRNYLAHGMLHRPVSQKDCKMLFLLFYNFTIHLNSFS